MAGNLTQAMGSGWDSSGRPVASNSRGPQFKSSFAKNVTIYIFTINWWKDENKEKEVENYHLGGKHADH